MCAHIVILLIVLLYLYANLYYAKTKWLLFEIKDNFQKCNSNIKTLFGLKTAAKHIWSILGRTKGSPCTEDPENIATRNRKYDVIIT